MPSKSLIVGRDRSADIPIADSSVSRRHAQVEIIDGGRIFLTDCQSSNGTFVIRSGQSIRITQETVSPGEQIRFGDVVMAVSDLTDLARRAGAAAPATPQAPHPGRNAAPEPLARSEKLVRCLCGAVIVAGKPCPFC
ncbi:MAG: FHA domain-containing protein [Bryobacterales bacterium]|nr:FHA domain-containing protein [Bryobacterales bacterium]